LAFDIKLVQADLAGLEARVHEEDLPELQKTWRFMTLEEQESWCAELDKMHMLDIELMKGCASEYTRLRCPKCKRGKVVYNGCKMRSFCPRCASSYALSKAKVQHAYLMQINSHLKFDLKMNQFTLTLPQNMERMPKSILVSMMRKFLRKVGITDYGYETQDAHSSDPLLPRRIHVHVLAFNFRRKRWSDALQEEHLVESQYFFDVVKLRGYWKSIVEETAGTKVEGDVNFKVQYLSVKYQKEKCIHQLAYLYRYPVTDLFRVWRDDRSYFKVRHFNQLGYFKTKDRLSWCGLLSPHGRVKLQKILAVMLHRQHVGIDSIPVVRMRMGMGEKNCPDCLVYYVVVDRGKYNGDNEPVRLER